ncbi:phosphoinositide phospholipase C 2-like [Andrographis paniculata]|uniref:phosphoinositide phospholipase C 2-like n=1 Tax=Andrographis paniculata TaxID=175694 RepID=UPI0021E76B25|nr:phosphoinositide phospholipase C 2-like [Andrographis paniculata]
MSRQTYRVCFCFRRRFRLAAADAPADIKNIFKEYSEGGMMSVDQLRRFMVEVQGERNATVESAQGIVDGLKHLHIFHRRGLSLEAFFRYLIGDGNPPLDPKPEIHHDMTAPLSNYFIFTSHNTYLTGNQISSDSSDIPIVRALRGGVRVIELDLWPNSAKDDVDVLHGRTLTTPVELIKCLKSIKEHAFIASEYPVVLTFEDHLTADLRALVAQMITQTFGEMLYTTDLDLQRQFPCPESLKRRILVSTKLPKRSGSQIVKEMESRKGRVSNKDKAQRTEETSYNKDDSTDGMDIEIDEDIEKDPKLQQHIIPEYMNLISIPAGKVKGGIRDWLRVDPSKVRRLSLSEQEFERATNDYGEDIIRFTQRNLLRVYPKAARLDSSNYNPMIAWMHGAQMVALNLQGYGKSLRLMHGMFTANGGCGYVKKPDFLLNTGPNIFNPRAHLPVKTTLRVNVYMGEGWYYEFPHTHFDSYSPPDFYAKIAIVGVPADTMKRKTKIIDDTFIPTWDDLFVFPLTVPELALLRIEVRESDASGQTNFAGQTCLPVSELRQGIRAVPLYGRKGERYRYVRLLMRFEFV